MMWRRSATSCSGGISSPSLSPYARSVIPLPGHSTEPSARAQGLRFESSPASATETRTTSPWIESKRMALSLPWSLLPLMPSTAVPAPSEPLASTAEDSLP